MRRSKGAGWNSPAGSYSYIHEDLWRPEKKPRRSFKYTKFVALAVVVLGVVALRVEVFPSRHVAEPVASAAALPQVAVQAKIMENKPDVSAKLSSEINAFVAANQKQQWGVSLHQLNGGDSQAEYQPGQTFYPASIYKLLILESLFEKLPYSSWNRMMSGGTSYGNCIDRMMRLSDNDCGLALGSYVNWTTVTNKLKALGLTNTALNISDKLNYTSAADVDTFLQYFYHSYNYSEAKASVMKSMATQIYRDGIPAGSPGCIVYDKIGDMNGFRHDAAVVDCGSIKYTLVIMSQGGSYAQIADLASRLNRVIAPGS